MRRVLEGGQEGLAMNFLNVTKLDNGFTLVGYSKAGPVSRYFPSWKEAKEFIAGMEL
jgi:hypothetical protein